jgi:cell cycle arrest protein BUB3
MRKFPSPITGLSFSPDGTYLAIATTYMYEDDQIITPPEPSLTIRKMGELEVRPKE